jgi:hypothetical protein
MKHTGYKFIVSYKVFLLSSGGLIREYILNKVEKVSLRDFYLGIFFFFISNKVIYILINICRLPGIDILSFEKRNMVDWTNKVSRIGIRPYA